MPIRRFTIEEALARVKRKELVEVFVVVDENGRFIEGAEVPEREVALDSEEGEAWDKLKKELMEKYPSFRIIYVSHLVCSPLEHTLIDFEIYPQDAKQKVG